jgi:peptidylprolyl isomerase
MPAPRWSLRILPVTGAALAGLVIGSPCGAAADAGQILAKGGSIELTPADVRNVVGTLPDDSRKALHGSLPALEQLLRAEILERAILADARAQNFERDPGASLQLERLRQEALTRLWVAKHTAVPADYPAETDVKAAYEALHNALPLEYHVAQIFISAPNGADPAVLSAALRKAVDVGTKATGGDFAKLAREQSDDAESAQKGGDLGFVAGERLQPEVAKVLHGLSPGQVVGPIKSAEGLRFLKLIESRPVTLPPLAEVHDRIVADLRTRRSQQLQRAYLSELNGKLAISFNEIELAKLQASLN